MKPGEHRPLTAVEPLKPRRLLVALRYSLLQRGREQEVVERRLAYSQLYKQCLERLDLNYGAVHTIHDGSSRFERLILQGNDPQSEIIIDKIQSQAGPQWRIIKSLRQMPLGPHIAELRINQVYHCTPLAASQYREELSLSWPNTSPSVIGRQKDGQPPTDYISKYLGQQTNLPPAEALALSTLVADRHLTPTERHPHPLLLQAVTPQPQVAYSH